jgi:hypothetical protein
MSLQPGSIDADGLARTSDGKLYVTLGAGSTISAAAPLRTYGVGSEGATDYERLSLNYTTAVFEVRVEAGGSGVARSLRVYAGGQLEFGTGGTARWQVNSSGHYVAATDNTYDIGQSGATRPRNIYCAGQIDSAGVTRHNSATATPAGGAQAMSIGTTSALGLYYGSGAPTISAAQGSIYIRTDGSSTSTRLYVNTNGATGWTNVTTAA